MALSDADLRGIAAHQEPRVLLHHEVVKFTRAIEAEVRKEYEKEIQRLKQLLELNQIKYTEPQIAALLKKGENHRKMC